MFNYCMAVVISFTVSIDLMAQQFKDFEKLGIRINTEEYDEASPVINLAGDRLYFTRTGSPDFERGVYENGEDISQGMAESAYRRLLSDIYSQIAGKPVRDPYISPYNQDIHVGRIRHDRVDSVWHPGYPINNALPNSVLSASGDSSSLMLLNQFYSSGNMHEGVSQVRVDSAGGFEFPEPVHFYEFYNRSGDLNLALNRHGTVMVISLERDDSHGQNDLYISFKIRDDLWSEPENLGDDLNTAFQESTPFVTQDGRYLYFASDRPGTAGGMDIWVSNRLDYTWKKWSKPKRLAEPINSPYDDAQAYQDEVNDYLYFASKRDGSSDIYRISLQPLPKLSKPLIIDILVVDGDNGKPLRAEVFYGPETIDGYLEYFHTYTGELSTELIEYDVYKFFARKPGYQPAHLKFDARLADMQDLERHYMVLKLYRKVPVEPPVATKFTFDSTETVSLLGVKLAELQVGQTFRFDNIYFAKGEAKVLPGSYKALDQLAVALNKNPSVTIQIEGHTDNVGSEKDLMELSWQRSEAIRAYLMEQGVDGNRMHTRGFGPLRPLNNNSTEESRKRNRRVEIRVLGN